MTRFLAAMLLSLALAIPGAFAAAPTDAARSQQLTQLFDALKAAPDEAAGQVIEQQILSIWLDSGDPAINQRMERAIAAMNASAFDLALDYLDSIIAERPDYIEGWNKRATVYYLIGRYDDSIADIDKTLALDPRHFGAIAGKGLVELELGDDEKALAAFKQALAVDPQLADIQREVRSLENKLSRVKI